jgi:hypothetical protein
MVMGQEERKNKAKLEKTQINVATSNTEYEAAIKALEETTGRWNRDWKAAADKFQDLEEERLDFMKSSLWSFANIASTVCVSDDASCEKIRLSLENCEVERDIVTFIKERGTGQEIPDPPRYINFCRGDVNDTQSEASEDESYSVAQFQRTINPAFRSSSPQPSMFESHNDPKSILARELGHHEPDTPPSRETTLTPQKAIADRSRHVQPEYQRETSRLQHEQPQNIQRNTVPQDPYTVEVTKKEPNRLQYEQSQHSKRASVSQEPYTIEGTKKEQSRLQYDKSQHGPLAAVPHDPYPMDGMTMLCRTGPPSERSSAHSGMRPSSCDSQSEYSNPTSLSSQEPPSGKQSPVKQDIVLSPAGEKQVQKRKSGFFQSHSPFRRKSKHEKDLQSIAATTSNRNTWTARSTTSQNSSIRHHQNYSQNSRANVITDRPTGSPEPVDPRASFQLNVGNNVFDVAAPERSKRSGRDSPSQNREELDPIAQALAELKGVTKQSSVRISADHYHGISTPAPGSTSATRPAPPPMGNGALMAGMRGTPPPSYDQPVQRLGLPQPAFTSKAMQQTSQKYATQTQSMFSTPQRPESRGDYNSGSMPRPGTRGSDIPRATSPAPPRSLSPRPIVQAEVRQAYRSTSPNPYAASQQRTFPQTSLQKRGSDQAYYRHNSADVVRAISPAPFRDHLDRPSSSHTNSEMAIQLAPAPDDYSGSQRGRGNGRPGTGGSARPMSLYNGPPQPQAASRQRSKSTADGRQFSKDGRPILHFGKLQYPLITLY